jgi:putative intracellular protease/amidase
MTNTIAILLFDGAEEMDFVGPWQVFTTGSMV